MVVNDYDYIIVGGGASGLLLAYRMSQDPYFDTKSILLIEKDFKNENDRTWCYWEEGIGEWDHLTAKIWDHIYFSSPSYKSNIHLGTARYKMVRSAKWYKFLKEAIQQHLGITELHTTVQEINESKEDCQVHTTNGIYTSKKVFNSIPNFSRLQNQTTFPYLKQHFIGWFIEVEENTFDDSKATFMDFDIPQNGNTRFMYVLPLTPKKALVEYTMFSHEILADDDYEEEIIQYLNKMGINNYSVIEKEKGNIPMTCYPFEKHNSSHILHIGTAGGWTKPSTGYTFARTSAFTSKLVTFLKKEKNLTQFSIKKRHWYYDLVLLDVLDKNNSLGNKIFTSIFQSSDIQTIFVFLDEKSNVFTDLKVMLQTKPFFDFFRSALKLISRWPKIAKRLEKVK